MIASKKRRSSDSDCDVFVSSVPAQRVRGVPVCTPNGISVVSSPLYSEYTVAADAASELMRPLVHCKSRDWWVERQQASALGISHAWIYTDAPSRRVSVSDVCAVQNPVILPFLHRRARIFDMRHLRHYFCGIDFRDHASLVISVLCEAEKLFGFRLSDLWSRASALPDFTSSFSRNNFVMCGKKSQGRCYACDRNYVIVSEFCGSKMCNKCSKRVHALVALGSCIPQGPRHLRQDNVFFSSLVDCCMTIEENFRSESPRVLDYSKQHL